MDLVNFLFPRKCLECKKERRYICTDCIQKVRVGGISSKGNLKVFSVFRYEGVIRKAIISLKYKFATDISEELIALSVKKLKESNYFKGDNLILVPIPLHRQRENWRGFNQTEIIGEKLAKEMNWKYIPDLLVRNKNTTPQVGLKGVVRRNNLSGVFSVCVSNILHPTSYILLFDDVYTTGSTIREAKKVLTEAGFKNIYSLTIAR